MWLPLISAKAGGKGETDIDRKVLTFLPTKDGKNIISMEIVIGGYAYSSLAAKAMRK